MDGARESMDAYRELHSSLKTQFPTLVALWENSYNQALLTRAQGQSIAEIKAAMAVFDVKDYKGKNLILIRPYHN